MYEVDSMVPDTGCRDIAEATILLLLHNVPSFLRPLGREIVSSLLAPRLRAAVMSVLTPPSTNRTNLARRTGCPNPQLSFNPPSGSHSTPAPSSPATFSSRARRKTS